MNYFHNPMSVLFYELHQNNLIYGENLLDDKYLCAILEGDWNEFKLKLEWTDDKNIRYLN